MKKYNFFSCKFISVFDNQILGSGLDPDPDQMNADPQPCFDELLAAEHEFLYLAKHRT
jgi:hypothetical protein